VTTGCGILAISELIVERRGRVGTLTLNRPEAINALTAGMIAAMTDALDAWRDDDAITTVVLRGAGERGLCAGGDIVAVHREILAGGSANADLWRAEYELNAMIHRYPKHYVAIQDGLVLGGGIGISAHGSIRVVTETSQLGMPETAIGFVPDVGGTWLLGRAPGELGTHLLLSGETVAAADAIQVGLADHFIPRGRLDAFVDALAETAAESVVHLFAEPPPLGTLRAAVPWVDRAYAADDVPAIVAGLAEEAAPDAAAAREQLLRRSPTALVATLAAVRRARELPDLESALDQDYRVSLRFQHEPDFIEGIRAQVIDKDRRPRWRPAQLADVDPARVEGFFAPLETELGLGPLRRGERG